MKLRDLAAEQHVVLQAERERHARERALREEQFASERQLLATRHAEMIAQAAFVAEERTKAAAQGVALRGVQDAEESAEMRTSEQSRQ